MPDNLLQKKNKIIFPFDGADNPGAYLERKWESALRLTYTQGASFYASTVFIVI